MSLKDIILVGIISGFAGTFGFVLALFFLIFVVAEIHDLYIDLKYKWSK